LKLQSWRGERLLLGLRICGWVLRVSVTLSKSGGGRLGVNGFVTYVVANKLKYIKVKLKIKNREVFGDIRTKKICIKSIINSLDTKEEFDGLTSDELLQRKVAKDDWAKFTLMEETS